MIKALGSLFLLGTTATDANSNDVIGKIYERPMAGLLVEAETNECEYQGDEDTVFWENLLSNPLHRESLLLELAEQANMSTRSELEELLNSTHPWGAEETEKVLTCCIHPHSHPHPWGPPPHPVPVPVPVPTPYYEPYYEPSYEPAPAHDCCYTDSTHCHEGQQCCAHSTRRSYTKAACYDRRHGGVHHCYWSHQGQCKVARPRRLRGLQSSTHENSSATEEASVSEEAALSEESNSENAASMYETSSATEEEFVSEEAALSEDSNAENASMHETSAEPMQNASDDCESQAPSACCNVEGYGEMAPEAVEAIAALLQLSDQPVSSFFDLGSGVGKLVLHMAVKGYARLSSGVELNTARHALAVELAERVLPNTTQFTSAALPFHGDLPSEGVNLMQGDMLQANFSSASMLYLNPPCLPCPVRQKLVQKIIAECSAKYVVTTLPLPSLVRSSAYVEEVTEVLQPMQGYSWSIPITIYRRV